jgi:hypothetical protein
LENKSKIILVLLFVFFGLGLSFDLIFNLVSSKSGNHRQKKTRAKGTKKNKQVEIKKKIVLLNYFFLVWFLFSTFLLLLFFSF